MELNAEDMVAVGSFCVAAQKPMTKSPPRTCAAMGLGTHPQSHAGLWGTKTPTAWIAAASSPICNSDKLDAADVALMPQRTMQPLC